MTIGKSGQSTQNRPSRTPGAKTHTGNWNKGLGAPRKKR